MPFNETNLCFDKNLKLIVGKTTELVLDYNTLYIDIAAKINSQDCKL